MLHGPDEAVVFESTGKLSFVRQPHTSTRCLRKDCTAEPRQERTLDRKPDPKVEICL
jgi:hypothetical protein